MAGNEDKYETITLDRLAALGNIKRIHLRARSSEFSPRDDVQFFFAVELEDGKQYAAKEIILQPLVRYTPISSCIEVPGHELQALVNDLWDVRVRPHDALASSGQLETINNHLADLRRLVFDYEVKSKPPVKGGAT
jgi:hypothetical protein